MLIASLARQRQGGGHGDIVLRAGERQGGQGIKRGGGGEEKEAEAGHWRGKYRHSGRSCIGICCHQGQGETGNMKHSL